MRKTTYSLHDLLGINAGLYGFDDIEFQDTKDNILSNFEEQYEEKLSNALLKIGLKLISILYYSPKYYNYETDSLDIHVEVVNKEKLKPFIEKYSDEIQQALDSNKSYDGYMALTVNSVSQEIENMSKDDYTPDPIVLGVILNHLIDIDFYYVDYLIYEE